MRKEIIDCINNKLVEQKELQRLEDIETKKRAAIRANEVLLEKFERENTLIPTIEKFFSDLPKGRLFTISTVFRNDPDNPQDIDRGPGYHTYPIQVYYNTNLKLLDFEIIEIENKTFYGVEIIGRMNGEERRYDYQRRHGYYDYYNRRNYNEGKSFKNWDNSNLKRFIAELPWFEEQIAKEYGCLNP